MDRRAQLPTAAAAAWGAGLAVVVGLDGSWAWIVARLVAVGAGTGAVVWIVRQRPSAGTALLVAGIVGLVVGLGIGVSHLARHGEPVAAVGGLVCLLAGFVLLVGGARKLLRGRGRWGRLAGGVGITLATGLVALTFVPAVMATNVPPIRLGNDTPGTFGLAYDDVTFVAADGVALAAWYVASTNGAAVVLRHGAGSTRDDVLDEAVVLAGAGYGVLLTDARGHGTSGGRAMDFGWYGDADIVAAVTFLSSRADIDPDRIGVVGLSMGGEEAIGAAAADARVHAVVAEGATGRTAADHAWLSDAYGVRGTLQRGIEWLRYSLTDLLTSARGRAASPTRSTAPPRRRSC